MQNTLTAFYSFSRLGTEAIYRHVDTFQAGKYSFTTKEVTIAEGDGGCVFKTHKLQKLNKVEKIVEPPPMAASQ